MPVISSPWNKTYPSEGFKFPAIKLNKVVFPDPFGPMIPVIEPFLIFNEQGVKELRKSGFYKSLEKSLNSIFKRLSKV